MNQAGRDALRAAALDGVRQIRDDLRDEGGGRCGIGVLYDAEDGACRTVTDLLVRFDLAAVAQCALCGAAQRELSLVAHLNDTHGLDLLGIASKMPVTDAEPRP